MFWIQFDTAALLPPSPVPGIQPAGTTTGGSVRGGLKCLFSSVSGASRLPPNYSLLRMPQTDVRSRSRLNCMRCHETHQGWILSTCWDQRIHPKSFCLEKQRLLPSFLCCCLLLPPLPLSLHVSECSLVLAYLSSPCPTLLIDIKPTCSPRSQHCLQACSWFSLLSHPNPAYSYHPFLFKGCRLLRSYSNRLEENRTRGFSDESSVFPTWNLSFGATACRIVLNAPCLFSRIRQMAHNESGSFLRWTVKPIISC